VLAEPHHGVCAARQTGTANARGEIIVSTDADTVFPPDWLSTISHAFAGSPDVVAATGAVTFANAPWWGGLLTAMLFGVNRAVFERTGRLHYISACNTAFRRSAWTAYKTTLTQGGDELDLLRQLSARGRVVFRPEMRVQTSSRRFHGGFVHHMLVYVIWFYILNHAIGRLIGRSPFGSYAAVRHEPVRRSPLWWAFRSAAIVVILALAVTTAIHPAAAQHIVKRTGAHLGSLVGKIPHREWGPWAG
jgi:glycosyltransferase involved in cell wall biosynthesis